MEKREAQAVEIKYAQKQSTQINAQCGNVGQGSGSFESGQLVHSWKSQNTSLDTADFQAELKNALDMLEAAPKNALRIDGKMHAFMVTPCAENQNEFSVQAYVAEWLDEHIGKAKGGIRFINSEYKELFRLTDGESVVATYQDGTKKNWQCRYIDETHVEVGNELYHICQLAETMERNGTSCAPLKGAQLAQEQGHQQKKKNIEKER